MASTVGPGNVWPSANPVQPLTDCFAGSGCGGILYEGGIGTFIVLLLALGGGCALLAGRSVASGWRPAWFTVPYGVLLAAAVRYLHYGLLRGTLLSPYYFVIDAAILILLGYLGYRGTMASQIVRQYPWLYQRSGPLSWTANTDAAGHSG
jgi:hypothetical protein